MNARTLNIIKGLAMKCIFESNLYNNPTHNRHILREMLEEPGMDEFRELEADGPSDAELDAIEHGDETAGEVDIPDEEDPTMRLGHGEDSTVRDYVERESPEAIAAFSEDELNQLVRDVDIKEINNKIAAFMSGQMESCCVMASNLLGRQGYGSAILREDYQLQSMLSVEGNPQYEEPEVKKEPKPKEPRLTAKRNRRLRSKSRNIQIWDKKKKRFDPRYINTRFTRMCDAKEAIKKLGEADETWDDFDFDHPNDPVAAADFADVWSPGEESYEAKRRREEEEYKKNHPEPARYAIEYIKEFYSGAPKHIRKMAFEKFLDAVEPHETDGQALDKDQLFKIANDVIAGFMSSKSRNVFDDDGSDATNYEIPDIWNRGIHTEWDD